LEKDPQRKQEIEKAAKTLEEGGSQFMIFGLFLVAMGGLGIACGVLLIMQKAQLLVLGVGVGQIAADVISCMLLNHVGITNILAFVAGALVIVAALTYPKAPPVVTT
jgi:hypothetical protein